MSARGVVLGKTVGGVPQAQWLMLHVDPLLLRECALFFDRIDYPRFDTIEEGPEPEIELLEQAGLLIRSVAPAPQGVGQLLIAYLHGTLASVLAHNVEEPGVWTLAQPGASFVLPPDLPVASTVVMTLYRAVPVLTEEVPIEDIVSFRERRGDQLLEFRGAIDDLYQEISASGDLPHAKVRAIDRIEQSLADLERLMRERRLPRSLATVKVTLNLRDMILGAAVGASFAAKVMVNPVAGAGAGVLMSAVRLDIAKVLQPEVPPSLRDYSYLFHARTEFQEAVERANTVRRPVPEQSEREILLAMVRESDRRAARAARLLG